ncbi:hypothetical protein BKA70DRAFT_1406697 [Coprinopsis sp. MPI-PUGE-AT-0042]|nr:hypothetical protein BKA70DRAFT_1406697 [Coprinopsis sp. MPI-PUGE-AT-0042]
MYGPSVSKTILRLESGTGSLDNAGVASQAGATDGVALSTSGRPTMFRITLEVLKFVAYEITPVIPMRREAKAELISYYATFSSNEQTQPALRWSNLLSPQSQKEYDTALPLLSVWESNPGRITGACTNRYTTWGKVKQQVVNSRRFPAPPPDMNPGGDPTIPNEEGPVDPVGEKEKWAKGKQKLKNGFARAINGRSLTAVEAPSTMWLMDMKPVVWRTVRMLERKTFTSHLTVPLRDAAPTGVQNDEWSTSRKRSGRDFLQDGDRQALDMYGLLSSLFLGHSPDINDNRLKRRGIGPLPKAMTNITASLMKLGDRHPSSASDCHGVSGSGLMVRSLLAPVPPIALPFALGRRQPFLSPPPPSPLPRLSAVSFYACPRLRPLTPAPRSRSYADLEWIHELQDGVVQMVVVMVTWLICSPDDAETLVNVEFIREAAG